MFACCAAVFIALSGICLHRLIIGPGSLSRFYKLFALAFACHAVGWTVLWQWLHGYEGIIGGLLAGTALMGLHPRRRAFEAPRSLWKIYPRAFCLQHPRLLAGGWGRGEIRASTGWRL